MLRACLVQSSVLKKMVEVMGNVAAERVNFLFSTAGFSLQATNLSQSAMVAILLPSDAFASYYCDRTISFGLSLCSMSRIFRALSDDDVITIKTTHGGDSVTFIFESPNKVSQVRMHQMDIEHEQLLHVPETEYHAIVQTEYHAVLKMPSAVFARICSELAGVGDTVTIKITDKDAKFSTKGELGTSTVVCRPNLDVDKPEEAVVIDTNETVRVTFSLRLINSFTETAPMLSNAVTISFLSDMPSVLEFKIAEVATVRFYLLPMKQV